MSLSQQQELRAILEKGLPHAAQPYLLIAQALNTTEAQVLAQIQLWQEDSLIKRFGLVVKHRKLGFKANAMVVWNIADEQVDDVAAQLSSCSEVSLCYRRPRRLPDWPYNLFCMIHGTDREIVTAQIDAMVKKFSLSYVEKDILFSFKAYKQQGARYTKQGI
ncbi:Lrp/AsnC family transcriptional regulator [Colwellia sp. Arc7-635]|nr:Lrp/AsnC family transcriptional regulator [Colwellia sp. Arc7-635]